MRLSLDALHRRALVNGAVAAVVTLVIGVGVVSTVTGEDAEPPVAGPTSSPSPTPPACEPSWEVTQSADPGDLPNTLLGVAALAASEAWAVGGSGDPAAPVATLIERWDGVTWTAEEGPNPGSQTNEIRAVDASEPNDVWAVGRTASGFGERPLVLHYDGTQWLDVELPAEVTGVLTGVAAIAPNDVWVVGFAGDPDADLESGLILHWDGLLWAVADTGRALGVGKSALRDVEALAADDVWAVGYLHGNPLIIRFDGQTWSRLDTEVDGLTNAVRPLTPTDAWAVGAPIQRFDGIAWSLVVNVRAESQLLGIAAVSPSDVWAVGYRPSETGLTKALVLRFDGQRWRPVHGQGAPGSDVLTDVDALPDGTILAVGYKDIELGRRTLTIRATTCPPTT